VDRDEVDSEPTAFRNQRRHRPKRKSKVVCGNAQWREVEKLPLARKEGEKDGTLEGYFQFLKWMGGAHFRHQREGSPGLASLVLINGGDWGGFQVNKGANHVL